MDSVVLNLLQNTLGVESNHVLPEVPQTETPTIVQRMSSSKSIDSSKPPKNQYDKNIFGNISKTILKQLVGGDYKEEIRSYCAFLGVDFPAFMDSFARMDR
jgi:hypothetical protein